MSADEGATPKPEEVFTPATPVQVEMFATRRHEHLQDRVEAALGEHGRQVVLYGDTGVGKTSLVLFLAEDREIKLVSIGCGPTFDEMMRETLAVLIGGEEVEQLDRSLRGGEFGAVLNIFTGKVKSETGRDVKTVRYPTTLGTAVAEAFRVMGVRVLFLDNFENVLAADHRDETARQVVELMKEFSDLATYYGADAPKVVVAGIPIASEQLLAMDEATARRTAEIEVGRMPEAELDEILQKGESRLKIEFAGLVRERILYYSDGFPYYTHLLALESVRAANRRESDVVDLQDFEAALDAVLVNADLSLRTAYEGAVETGGDVQVRKSVLHAMANLNSVEVSFGDIRAAFLELHKDRYDNLEQLNFISPQMSRLVDEFEVLEDRGLRKSIKNRYRFKNPLMRAYVRLRMLSEQRERLGI